MKFLGRNFFLLWQGQLVSQLSVQMLSVSLIFWLKHATESATVLGLLMMTLTLPSVLIGPLGGTFADRYRRKVIIVLCDILTGLSALSLAVVFFVAESNHELLISWLFFIAFFVGVIAAFFGPAMLAIVPELVPAEKVTRANSMLQIVSRLAIFVGQGIGGLMFRLLGVPIVSLVSGIAFLLSAASESFISDGYQATIKSKEKNNQNFLIEFYGQMIEGFRYLWGNKGMRDLFIFFAFFAFFSTPITILLPFYVEDVLGVEADWYGFLIAAFSIATFAGYLLAGLLQIKARDRGVWFIISLAIIAISTGSLGMIHTPILALLPIFMSGMVSGFVSINIITAMQLNIQADMRGRVMGLLMMLIGAPSAIAAAVTGVVTDLIGKNIPVIYIACGLIMILLIMIVSFNRDLQDFLAYEYKSPQGARPRGSGLVSSHEP